MNFNRPTSNFSEQIRQQSAQLQIEINLQSRLLKWSILKDQTGTEASKSEPANMALQARVKLMENGAAQNQSLDTIAGILRSTLDYELAAEVFDQVQDQRLPVEVWAEQFRAVVSNLSKRIEQNRSEALNNDTNTRLEALGEYIQNRIESLRGLGVEPGTSRELLMGEASSNLSPDCLYVLEAYAKGAQRGF